MSVTSQTAHTNANDHHMPLNEPAHENFLCTPLVGEGLQTEVRWFLDADDNPDSHQNLIITFWLRNRTFPSGRFGLKTFRSDYEILQKFYIFTFQCRRT